MSGHLANAALTLGAILNGREGQDGFVVRVREGKGADAVGPAGDDVGAVADDSNAVGDRDPLAAARRPDHDRLEQAA